jgi:hypothetical protein
MSLNQYINSITIRTSAIKSKIQSPTKPTGNKNQRYAQAVKHFSMAPCPLNALELTTHKIAISPGTITAPVSRNSAIP